MVRKNINADDHPAQTPTAQGAQRKLRTADRREFTPGMIAEFNESKYVARATRRTVSYTLAFKELFWKRYSDGERPEDIFRSCGINPDVLGPTRVWGVVSTLRKQIEQGKPFLEGSEPHLSVHKVEKFAIPKPPRPPKMPRNPARTVSDAEIVKLYHQVAYLSQEMEFIKKTILAGMGVKPK